VNQAAAAGRFMGGGAMDAGVQERKPSNTTGLAPEDFKRHSSSHGVPGKRKVWRGHIQNVLCHCFD
jgi:hypothetical protein